MKTIQAVKQKMLQQANNTLKRQEFYAKHGGGVPTAQQEQYKALVQFVVDEETPVHFTFQGDTVNEKADSIMYAISQGQITPRQGETLMNILRSGFEVSEMRELMQKINDAGLIPSSR